MGSMSLYFEFEDLLPFYCSYIAVLLQFYCGFIAVLFLFYNIFSLVAVFRLY